MHILVSRFFSTNKYFDNFCWKFNLNLKRSILDYVLIIFGTHSNKSLKQLTYNIYKMFQKLFFWDSTESLILDPVVYILYWISSFVQVFVLTIVNTDFLSSSSLSLLSHCSLLFIHFWYTQEADYLWALIFWHN